jgi:hypothetical protein
MIRATFQDRHSGAEAATGLRQLAPDRPAADDDQVIRPLLQIKDRFVGEMEAGIEAINRRPRRLRAGSDDEAPGVNAKAAGIDFPRAGKACLRLDHAHAQALEPLHGVGGRDFGDYGVNMVVDLAEVNMGVGINAKVRALAGADGGMGGGDQRLRRHAPVIQTIAPHLAFLDQNDPRAHLRRAGGHRQAS